MYQYGKEIYFVLVLVFYCFTYAYILSKGIITFHYVAIAAS